METNENSKSFLFSTKSLNKTKALLITILAFICLFKPTNQILHNYYYNLKDKLYVSVGSLNSISAQIPFDYYYLNICKPEKLVSVSDNLGLLLSHEITYKTNYEITLNELSYCNVLCKNDFTPMELELVKWMIRRDFKVKYYLDKLPAGYNLYPLKDKNNNPEIHYSSGIPLGYYVSNADGSETFYIYNHLTFNVKVHYEKNLDKYTIVGFDIIPISINHQIAGYMVNNGVIIDKADKANEKGVNAEKESGIKDLNGESKGNVATHESKARNDEARRILTGEDFLKNEKADNKTEPASETKPDNKDQNASEAKANGKTEASEGENKNATVNEKPKSEGEKLYQDQTNKGTYNATSPKSGKTNDNVTNNDNKAYANQDVLKCANSKENYNLNFFDVEKQILRNKIIFTYDVVFELSDVSFSSRWDHYLHMDRDKIHWYNLINSSLIIIIISSVVVYIFMRAVKREIEVYNTRVTGEEFLDEFGWKQVSGDVFRKPRNPMLLSCFLGTGIQLFFMVIYTLLFSFFGFFRPESRGSLIYAMLLLFVFLGLVNGYVSSRFLKMFQGTNWLLSSLFNAIFYPLIIFSIIFFINIFLSLENSSAALKITDILSLLLLWLCCSSPLVLLGSFIGIKNKPIKNPGKINLLPMQIPDKPWYLKLKVLCLIGGVLPFGAIFIELVYIMGSIWRQYMYYLFGFLFIVLILLLITCSEISILLNYVLLCKGDYNWWWKSYFISGSPAIYVILYSIYYFFTLNITRLSAIVVYFGLMAIISSFIFLICGSVGFLATFAFLRKIYSMIKLD